MPCMSGPEVSSNIREYEKENRKSKVQIIGVTGYESKELEEEAKEAGMDCVITKPIKRNELNRLLDMCETQREQEF